MVELKTVSIGQWMPRADWTLLEKLSVRVLRSVVGPSLGIVLPNLREASLIFLGTREYGNIAEENSLDYKSFVSLIFECKRLETFNLQLEDNNRILDFDEEDFCRRLENKGLNLRLKNLTLQCIDQSYRNRTFFPFKSLCKLVDKCKNLVHLHCKLESKEQVQIMKNKGFSLR